MSNEPTRRTFRLDSLPAVLLHYRGQRDLSQRALAARAGVAFATIGGIERGEHLPLVNTAACLVDALGLEIVIREKAR